MSNAPCTLCPDGGTFDRPNYVISLPGIPPGSTCQSIASLLPALYTVGSVECQQNYALISPLCGCSINLEDSCRICNTTTASNEQENNQMATSITDILPTMQFPDAVLTNLATPLFGNTIPDPSCEEVQAFLLNVPANATQCTFAQTEAALCGCVSFEQDNQVTAATTSSPEVTPKCSLCPQEGSVAAFPDKVVQVPGFPPSTCSVLELVTASLELDSPECANAQQLAVYCGCPRKPNSCHVCHDQSPILYPNQTLERLAADFGGQAPTCDIYDSIVAQQYLDGTAECTISRGPAIDCGCQSPFEDYCELCPGGIPKEFYDVPFELNPQVRCGVVEALETQMSARGSECFLSQQGMHWCGCRGGVWNYAGVETRTQQAVLAWAPRCTAFLSILGSSLILFHIFWRERKKKSYKTMYHQIMIAISVADLISSCAWLFSTLPIPKYDEAGVEIKIYGAMGNEKTCVAQGFFFALGNSSIFFSVALSIYYKFVIVDGWKEQSFTILRRVLVLGIPALIGIIIACAGIAYYDWSASICGIRILPWERHKKEFIVLVLVPGCTAVALVTFVTCYVYYRFKKQLEASNKWKFDARSQVYRSSIVKSQPTASRELESQPSSGALEDADSDSSSPRVGKRLIERIVSCFLFAWCIRWKNRLFETTLEGQVLRQSIFYLLAFYIFFPLSLVTAFLAGKYFIVSYPLSLVTVILLPLQGFNNALVFFRPKVISGLDRRKRRLSVLRRRPNEANDNDDTSRRSFLRAHFLRGSFQISARNLNEPRSTFNAGNNNEAEKENLPGDEDENEDDDDMQIAYFAAQLDQENASQFDQKNLVSSAAILNDIDEEDTEFIIGS